MPLTWQHVDNVSESLSGYKTAEGNGAQNDDVEIESRGSRGQRGEQTDGGEEEEETQAGNSDHKL